jgi:hypothetical protein
MPSHQKVWCGKRFTWFQEIFCVRKCRIPAAASTCGRLAAYPNTSGSQRLSVSTPSSSRKKRRPWTIWRISDSPEGTLQSASTHMLPTTSKRPSPARLRMPLPDRRVAVAHPRQLLRLGDGEAEVGVAVHHGQGGRERAGALADGLPQRPEPGRVDVGVADRA